MTPENFDIDKFCKDVNRCMDWMKTGVSLAVFSTIVAMMCVFYCAVFK